VSISRSPLAAAAGVPGRICLSMIVREPSSDFISLSCWPGRPGTKTGWAELNEHYDCTVNRVIFVTLQTFCRTALVKNQIFVLCLKSTTDGGCCMKSPVVKRSIVLAGHKTSVSLEDEFWRGLKEIAGKRLVTLSTLVDTIDAQRQQGNLSSALRLFVLEFYRSQIPEVEGREGLRELMDRPKPALS